MSDLAWERLQDKIEKTPPTLANLLTNNKTSSFIESLTQKYVQLSVQGSDIARLIRDVVLADMFIGDMPQELSQRLGIDPTTAREVANQIISQLFAPVIEDLKKVHREKFPGRLPAKPQGPTSSYQGQGGQASKPQEQGTGEQAHQQYASRYQGEDLPESGGNIIDLRQK